MIGSDDNSSSSEAARPSRKRRRRAALKECAVAIVSDDGVPTFRLGDLRRAFIEEPSESGPRLLVGVAVLSWRVVHRAAEGQACEDLCKALALSRWRREPAHTHFVLYDIVRCAWCRNPFPAGDMNDRVRNLMPGRVVAGVLNVYGPLARAARAGVPEVRCLWAAPFHLECRRLEGAPVKRFPTIDVAKSAAPANPCIRPTVLSVHYLKDPVQIAWFVASSSHLLSLSRAPAAQKDAVIAAFGPEEGRELNELAMTPPGRHFLAKARLKFDMVAALMARHFFRKVMSQGLRCDFTYFFDGSPASGYESLSCIENAVIAGRISVRRLPVTFVGYGHANALCKAMNFLWCLFLETGPYPEILRWKLRCCRGLTTDRGTERFLCDLPDVLPNFLSSIGAEAESCPPEEFLFPRGLWTPGWHHTFDNIIKHSLSCAPWFSRWLEQLRGLVKFFRVHTYRERLCRAVAEDDMCTKRLKTRPARFANWRWSTLKLVLGYFHETIFLLRPVWDETVFKSCENPRQAIVNRGTIHCDVFWHRMCVISDMVLLVHELRTWGAGCPCCESLRKEDPRAALGCPRAGRRLPEAFDRVQRFLQDCDEEIRAPSADSHSFGTLLTPELEEERQWMWRHLQITVREHTSYLDENPYILARAKDIAVMERARGIFERTELPRRHRVSNMFFDRNGASYKDAQRFISSGIMSASLCEELESLADIPIAEEKGESPHSQMNHEATRVRAARRPWLAATNRLESTVAAWRAYSTEELELFEKEWTNYKRVVQVRGTRGLRKVRLKMKRVCELFYRSTCDVPRLPADLQAPNLWRDLGHEARTAGDIVRGEYVKALLEAKHYYTFGGGATELPLTIFQLIWAVSPKTVWVRTDESEPLPYHRVGVCFLLRVGGGPPWPLAGTLPDIDVVVDVGGTEVLDLMKLAPFDVFRKTLHVWGRCPSPVEGAFRLQNPKLAHDKLLERFLYTDSGMPMYAILEKLQSRGWRPAVGAIPDITAPHAGPFSARFMRQRSRPYFVCLVIISDLFTRGLAVFPHNQCVSFYSALLRARNPSTVRPGEPAKVYVDLMKENDEILPAPNVLEDVGLIGSEDGSASDAGAHTQSDGGSSRDGGGIDGGGGGGMIGSDDCDSSSSDGGDASHAGGAGAESSAASDVGWPDEGDAIDAEDPPAPPPLADAPYPAVVYFRNHTFGLKVEAKPNVPNHEYFEVSCHCPGHESCRKRRSTAVHMRGELGRIAPLALLWAWVQAGAGQPDRHAHHRAAITQAAIVAAATELHDGGVLA